jgi:hypothetical protein
LSGRSWCGQSGCGGQCRRNARDQGVEIVTGDGGSAARAFRRR